MNKSIAKNFTKKPKSSWTEEHAIIYGNYRWLNEVPIHYCLASLSIANIWDEVRLMGEVPGVEKWGFEALFQRTVRSDWVNSINRNYLQDKDRFKFFPPVTIAMLPCEHNSPQRSYNGQSSFEFKKNKDGMRSARLPGLELKLPTVEAETLPSFGEPAIMSWDKNKFSALAIDGQHRISALRKFLPRDGQGNELKDIPAILLIIDPKLPKGRDLIQVTREIFIDINKNAKTVDESRIILLDDRNFYNGLTRKLILQAYPDGENQSTVEYQKLVEDDDFEILNGIPQELIDTSAGREATDVGKLKPWQFTSAFILNRTIRYFSFEDKFEKFEQLANTSDFTVDADDETAAAVAERRELYNSNEEDSVISDHDMLSFRPSVTEKLVNRVIRMHKGLWLGPLTAFKPYKDHIKNYISEIEKENGDLLRSILLSEGGISGKVEYKTKASIDLKSSDEQLFNKIKNTIEKLSKPRDWESSLVWYSVFQRGLIFQPDLLKYSIEQTLGRTFDSRQAFAIYYTKALDTLFNEGWFSKNTTINEFQVWNGIALKAGETGSLSMDGSDGAAKRTGQFLRLLVCCLATRDKGGVAHMKSLLNKQGIKSAWSTPLNAYVKQLRFIDSLTRDVLDTEEYEEKAKDILDRLLNELCETQI